MTRLSAVQRRYREMVQVLGVMKQRNEPAFIKELGQAVEGENINRRRLRGLLILMRSKFCVETREPLIEAVPRPLPAAPAAGQVAPPPNKYKITAAGDKFLQDLVPEEERVKLGLDAGAQE